VLARLIDQFDLISIDSIQKNMPIEKKISDETSEEWIDDELREQMNDDKVKVLLDERKQVLTFIRKIPVEKIMGMPFD
jgi:CMP-2-keto-3-deoxyoctulosonic acid synthetase